jgi:DNA-directed RNA polymerase alpha subunit
MSCLILEYPTGRVLQKIKKYEGLFALGIDELQLSIRCCDALRGSGIHTIGDLVELTERDVFMLRCVGEKSRRQIYEALENRGLHLRDGGK